MLSMFINAVFFCLHIQDVGLPSGTFASPPALHVGVRKAQAINLLRRFYGQANPNAPQPQCKIGRRVALLDEGEKGGEGEGDGDSRDSSNNADSTQ